MKQGPSMQTQGTQQRAATAEYVNVQARNRGLVLLKVRGLAKVKCDATWLALGA